MEKHNPFSEVISQIAQSLIERGAEVRTLRGGTKSIFLDENGEDGSQITTSVVILRGIPLHAEQTIRREYFTREVVNPSLDRTYQARLESEESEIHLANPGLHTHRPLITLTFQDKGPSAKYTSRIELRPQVGSVVYDNVTQIAIADGNRRYGVGIGRLVDFPQDPDSLIKAISEGERFCRDVPLAEIPHLPKIKDK